jgi:hypothetical protein
MVPVFLCVLCLLLFPADLAQTKCVLVLAVLCNSSASCHYHTLQDIPIFVYVERVRDYADRSGRMF